MSRGKRTKDRLTGSSDKPERRATRGTRQQLRDRKSEILGLQHAAGNHAVNRLLQSKVERSAEQINSVPPIVKEVVGSAGQPLSPNVRALMEDRFHHDFGQVRVHTDAQAADSAQAVSASAYTVGQDVVFADGQYAPTTGTGQRMLAHELAQVVQNSRLNSSAAGGLEVSDPSSQTEIAADAAAKQIHADSVPGLQPAARPGQLSRQPATPQIPDELQMSLDLSRLTVQQLHDRHDLIIATLAKFDEGSPETMPLELEAGHIGRELARRAALATGRTFPAPDVERMRKYFVKNANKEKPRNCIDTMNDGLQELYSDKKQQLGDSVDKTMGALQKSERAGDPVAIEFEDKKGKVSKSGALRPAKVHESVWDAILKMNAGEYWLGAKKMSRPTVKARALTDPVNGPEALPVWIRT